MPYHLGFSKCAAKMTSRLKQQITTLQDTQKNVIFPFSNQTAI